MFNGDIQFDIDSVQRSQYKRAGSKLTQWAMKYSGGLIKDEEQAHYVLLGFTVLAIIVSMFLFFGGKEKPYMPSRQEIQRAMTLPTNGATTK